MRFTKMHGLGNDDLYVFGEVPDNASELSIKLSERHFGAGSDGMIWISKSDIEGVVAKKKTSLYFFGKRTKHWLKIKNLMDDDFVVCGYIRKESNMSSIIIGQYEGHVLSYKGHVTLGVGGTPFSKIKSQPRILWPPFPGAVPSGNENAVWVEPRLVCTVEFMHRTKNGGMRQPVFKGLRDDKAPEDCVAWNG